MLKRLLQFASQTASLALVLALLAPPAFAALDCERAPVKTECAKTCCDGIDGTSMPMDASMPQPVAQLTQTPCCTLHPVEMTLPALVSVTQETRVVAVVLPATVVMPSSIAARSTAAEYPPGAALSQPSLAQLCSFRI
jgi:hypothetical protein